MSKHAPHSAAKQNRLLAQINDIYALFQHKQFTKAQSQINRLLTKAPKSAHAHTLAAMITVSLDQTDRALYHAQTAVKLDPKNTDALTTLASIHALASEHQAARDLYQEALAIQPDHPGALAGLGTSQSELGLYAAARTTLKQVQALNPSLPEPLVNRALLELDTTHAHRAIEILDSAPPAIKSHPAVLDLYALAHSYDDTKSPEQIFQAHKRYGEALESHLPQTTNHPNIKDPSRTLKVGYLSSDFHQHSITYFLEPILENAEKNSFESHIFTLSSHRDEVTERLDQAADHWHLCNAMNLKQLAEYIAAQQIDILVELSGHFAGNKLPVFAARPAPVQITFIGYGNTTGLSRINARLVDSITDPDGSDHLATESLVRLPGCFLCYQPPSQLPAITEPDNPRPFTLGSFNNLKKLSDSTIKVWSTILTERPDTNLLIKSSKLANSELRAELLERFANNAINESRLDLRAFSPTTQEHLDTYNHLDLALDTFPYTGTTTTCEALIMGLPTLTLLGSAHAGRVSASLLTAVGRQDMIAESESEYISKALARIDTGKPDQTARQTIRDQTLASPLCDQPTYTRKVEAAYRTLWTQWCATESKASR